MLEQWMENLSMTGEADMDAGGPERTDSAAAQSGQAAEALTEEEDTESGPPAKRTVTLEECVGKALEQGVNCIMIAAESSDEAVSRMETALGTKAEVLEGYYLFVIQ